MKKSEKIGLLIGSAISPPAIFAAIISGGAGHGDYYYAGLLFPIPLFMLPLGIAPVAVIYALAQYSYYGWFICNKIEEKKFKNLILVISGIHIIPMLAFVILRHSGRL